MYARMVEAPAKPGKRNEIITILEKEVQPLLKKEKGFVDFVGLTSDTTPDLGITMTFWATKEDAERFWNNREFKAILDRLTPLTQNMTARTFEVATSTFHKIAAGKAA